MLNKKEITEFGTYTPSIAVEIPSLDGDFIKAIHEALIQGCPEKDGFIINVEMRFNSVLIVIGNRLRPVYISTSIIEEVANKVKNIIQYDIDDLVDIPVSIIGHPIVYLIGRGKQFEAVCSSDSPSTDSLDALNRMNSCLGAKIPLCSFYNNEYIVSAYTTNNRGDITYKKDLIDIIYKFLDKSHNHKDICE